MKYRYDCTVLVRDIGAEGVYSPQVFTLLEVLPKQPARYLFSSWQEQWGDKLQPYVMTHVNGEETAGKIDQEFQGTEEA